MNKSVLSASDLSYVQLYLYTKCKLNNIYCLIELLNQYKIIYDYSNKNLIQINNIELLQSCDEEKYRKNNIK
jgi:hypothetical protein